MQLNLQKNVLYFSKNSWASTNAKLSMTFICKLFQSWLHVGPFMLYEVSPILVMSRRLRCFWKALVFLYAFEESVDCHLLSSFCDDSNLHISLFKYVLSTMGVNKESISKFLIGNRFQVKLRILSPENCKQSLQVKSWKAEVTAEKKQTQDYNRNFVIQAHKS